MESRRLWRVAIAVVAAGLALAGVLVLGGRVSDGGRHGDGLSADAGRHGEGGGADLGRHGGGLFAQNASHEGPPGQPPVTDLKVDRLRDAFNQAAGEPRILLSLSPT